MSTATAEAPTSDPITTDPEPTHGAQPPFDATVSTAAEETAPGPEAAAGAADAGVTTEATPGKPEPFDVVKMVEEYIRRTIDTAENEEEEVAGKVMRQSRAVARLNIGLLRIKAAEKQMKERLEEAVGDLDELEHEMRYELERKKVQPDLPFGEKPADDSWRSVRIDTLTPKIKPAKLEMLAKAGIETVGDVQDFAAKHGEWWTKEISGFGESGHKQIGDAMEAFWASRQKAADAAQAADANEAAAKLPGVDELRGLNDVRAENFTEDSIDQGTRETVAKIEKHLVIEVARRTSGPWQAGYWLQIAKLERMRHLGSGSTFPSRQDAIVDAIEAVGAHLAEANGAISGKANLAAAREVREVLEKVSKAYPASEFQ